MRIAVISDIHANLHALEAVLGDDRRGRRSTRSGASATSSATGRARTSASRSCGRGPTSASPATTTSPSSARPTSSSSSARPRPPRAGRASVLERRRRRRLSPRSSPRHEPRQRRARAREPADPVWEYILSQGSRGRGLRGHGGAAHPRRAQPRRARDLPRRRSSCAAGSPRRARGRPDVAAATPQPRLVGQPRDGDPARRLARD